MRGQRAVYPSVGWPDPRGFRQLCKAVGSQPLPGWHSPCWGSQEGWEGVSWLNMLESPRQRDAEDSKIINHLPSDMNNTIPEQVLALGMGCLGSSGHFCQVLSRAESSSFKG